MLHEGQRGRLRLHRLAWRAQASDAGEQGQRGRAALLGGVAHQPLADEFLHVAGRAARRPFPPPGAEQLAHHQLSIQRAAHRQQLTGSPRSISANSAFGGAAPKLAALGSTERVPFPRPGWPSRRGALVVGFAGSHGQLSRFSRRRATSTPDGGHVSACGRYYRASGTAGTGHSGHQVTDHQCNSREPESGYGVPGGRAGQAVTSLQCGQVKP